MRAVADGTESVQCRNADRGCEVAVGGASGGSFLEIDGHLSGDLARGFEEACSLRCPLHWRTIDGAADLQARPGQLRRQCLDRFRNAVGFFDRSDTNINLGGRLGRNDV